MPATNQRILFVDDEAHLLMGIQRSLFTHDFEIHTATSGAEALDVLTREAPFAVVVSDMRMPAMDGATFLAHVRREWPGCVRLLLTGQADIDAAVRAVNDGQIHRFMTKPCPTDVLSQALGDGVELFRLREVERSLLDLTLTGVADVFGELVRVHSPELAKFASAMTSVAGHLATCLPVEERWRLVIASRVAALGLMSIPDAILRRFCEGRAVDPVDVDVIEKSHRTAGSMIARVPRLAEVGAMVTHQGLPERAPEGPVSRGAQILFWANFIVAARARGQPDAATIAEIERQGTCPGDVVERIASWRGASSRHHPSSVTRSA